MGRAPCCDKANVKKGPWSPEEDIKLKEFIEKYGTGGNWIALPHKAGLKRCGKSCRLRWLNYLRPNIKHGEFSDDEDRIICSLFASIGSRWSIIAAQLPGRTDNDIKNYWNTKLKKKLLGLAPSQRKPPHQSHHHQHHNQQLLFPSPSPSPQSTAPKPLLTTGFEGFQTTIPHDIFNTNTSNSAALLQSPLVHHGSGLLMFGGDQQSCSSSDGSCTQISYAKDQLDQLEQIGSLESYLYGLPHEESQKLLLNNGASHVEWGEAPLEYAGLEEIKQLLNNNNNNNNNNPSSNGYNDMTFYVGVGDQIDPISPSATRSGGGSSFKTQGRVMYHV